MTTRAPSGDGRTDWAESLVEPPRALAGAPPRVLARMARAWIGDVLRARTAEARAEARYGEAREAAIARAIEAARVVGDDWLRTLGDGFGRGLDERVVEYPWALRRIAPGRLLDVGSTLNGAANIERLRAVGVREVAYLNPYRDDGYMSDAHGVSYVRADVRDHWLAPGSFTQVTCLSVLEHVGCDNTRYGGPATDPASTATGREQARAEAMAALRRLLAPGGRLLLTVPFGRAEDHGWFEQLDARALESAVRAFGPAAVETTIYAHDDGWRTSDAGACAVLRYAERTRGASAVACVELRV
jgi:SAM-dependent methyltransferase